MLVHSKRVEPETDWTIPLKALADESRLQIISALIKAPLHVNALAEIIGTSQYNVSKHLRILRGAGLVDCEVKANRREYVIAPRLRRRLASNRNVLDLGCCTFRFDRFAKK
jgi:DNA-binding transcriptional ArsR family regulator